jgi:hypothetical protein
MQEEISGLFHALVDQLDGQRSSKSPYAGSSPVERATGITNTEGGPAGKAALC